MIRCTCPKCGAVLIGSWGELRVTPLEAVISMSGLSRTDWAKRLNISKSYMSDLLNGNRVPSLDLAVRIERATDGAVPASSWLPEEAAE